MLRAVCQNRREGGRPFEDPGSLNKEFELRLVFSSRERFTRAIAEGIAQMEAGQGKPLHEVKAEVRAEFGYPPRA